MADGPNYHTENVEGDAESKQALVDESFHVGVTHL